MFIFLPLVPCIYDSVDGTDGVRILEQCMLELLEKHEDYHFILCVDFNSRTGAHHAIYTEDLFNVRSILYETG